MLVVWYEGVFAMEMERLGNMKASAKSTVKFWCCVSTVDPDKKDCITVDGTMELCQDLGIDPTQLDFLLVSYHLGSTQMGEFTRQPFVDGCVTLECSSIDQLKQSLATTFKNDLQDPAYFRKVYNYAFLFGRQGGQKNLGKMEWKWIESNGMA